MEQKGDWNAEKHLVETLPLTADDIVKIDVSGDECHYERKLLCAIPNSLLEIYFRKENIKKLKNSDKNLQ